MEFPWHSMDEQPKDFETVIVAFQEHDERLSYVAATYYESIHSDMPGNFFDWNGNNLEDEYFNGGSKMVGWQSFAPLVKGI